MTIDANIGLWVKHPDGTISAVDERGLENYLANQNYAFTGTNAKIKKITRDPRGLTVEIEY
jgi:hypothetical protein